MSRTYYRVKKSGFSTTAWKPAIALAAMLVGLAALSFGVVAGVALETIQISVNSSIYQVELATSSIQRQRGLMFREQLGADKGMLFVYPESGDHRIWMKNTLIPLQVIWIDEAHRVISIQRLQPCRDTRCETYGTQQASRYILELNDRDHAISNGDFIIGIGRFD